MKCIPRPIRPNSKTPSWSSDPCSERARVSDNTPGAQNANGIPAQAFDLVMTALRLHLDPGTGRQAVAIHQFSRGHILLNDANEWYPLRQPLRMEAFDARGTSPN
jgi:hypothetical protein